jgi:hypothetical protein
VNPAGATILVKKAAKSSAAMTLALVAGEETIQPHRAVLW